MQAQVMANKARTLAERFKLRFAELLNRARSQVAAADATRLTIEHSFSPEQVGPTGPSLTLGHTDERAHNRAAARERGLVPRLDGSRATGLSSEQLSLLTTQRNEWDAGVGETQDAWLADQVEKSIQRGGSHEDLLEIMDSISRAEQGKILLKPNTKAGPEQLAKTKFLSAITTRAQFQALIARSYAEQPAQCLAPKYLKARTSYVKGWERMMREGFGAMAWRLCWAMQLSKSQERREENYLIAWFTLCRLRYKTFGAAEQAVSHVVQFHLTHLDLVPPKFPRLYNRLRLARRGAAKDKDIRKRRPYIKPEHVSLIASKCAEFVANEEHARDDREQQADACWRHVVGAAEEGRREGAVAEGREAVHHRAAEDVE